MGRNPPDRRERGDVLSVAPGVRWAEDRARDRPQADEPELESPQCICPYCAIVCKTFSLPLLDGEGDGSSFAWRRDHPDGRGRRTRAYVRSKLDRKPRLSGGTGP